MSKIAVLMSSYNGEKYIREQIESIIQQDGEDIIDLWVRDDGSSDNTKDILKLYEAKKKLEWYTGDNLGPAKSFIDLIKHCEGYDFYAFSDQDDVWNKKKISVAVWCLRNRVEPAIYCSNAELVDAKLQSLHQNCNKYKPKYNLLGILVGGGVQGATVVFNKALAEKIREKEIPEFVSMHDYYISVVCLALGGSIIYDSDSYIKYRQHGSNVLGVNRGFFSTMKNRIELVQNKKGFFDIERTSRQIIKMYGKSIPKDNLALLKNVINYKRNFFIRIKLATCRGIGLGRLNKSFTERLSVLLGKV